MRSQIISDNDYSEIAKRLKAVRKELNLTLDQIAKSAGSSKTGVSEIERSCFKGSQNGKK